MTPRTELALRVYLACGLVIGWLGVAALWWVYGWTPVLVLVGAGVGVGIGVGGWMNRYEPQGGEE